ncbi:hypothetical protein B0T26DRAFT_728484 [Lasiosphaeria miniovina]|uniref:Uncharacterized protein n=1 Tax=Lasiosphaeria miniovina TaxID=1954250 RepID=A0AA40A068_9PEZI|nr:uncharacterized protein B0T26DRAFT_728484 [Lasiosphaeria miniovina]KAK0706891.1 hypothetical protein B0T26DRAFT_728484 [Lasiosphaeria miniovina]
MSRQVSEKRRPPIGSTVCYGLQAEHHSMELSSRDAAKSASRIRTPTSSLVQIFRVTSTYAASMSQIPVASSHRNREATASSVTWEN